MPAAAGQLEKKLKTKWKKIKNMDHALYLPGFFSLFLWFSTVFCHQKEKVFTLFLYLVFTVFALKQPFLPWFFHCSPPPLTGASDGPPAAAASPASAARRSEAPAG